MIKQLLCGSVVGLVLLISSCHAIDATTAERCVFVDLQAQQGHELIPLLEAFATGLGFESDLSHPVHPRFKRLSSANELEAEISYAIGVGEFGAMLSLFRFDKTHSTDLPERFDRYVEEMIATKYTVAPCAPEQYPTAYR